MYTQCPHCETVFRITAEQLQLARGDVRCGDCNEIFHALETLRDRPLPAAEFPAEFDNRTENQPAEENDASEELATEDQPPYRPEDSLEFDVPEQNWSVFFVESEPSPGHPPEYRRNDRESERTDSQPETTGNTVQDNTSDDSDDEIATSEYDETETTGRIPAFAPSSSSDDTSGHADDNPPWIRERVSENVPADRLRKQSGLLWSTIAFLTIALILQLAHYNRDTLAASAGYGELTFAIYSRLGQKLYPDWALDAFRVRSSEVVGGRGDTLKIQARVEIAGVNSVGLPMIRIALRDRWSNPVAGRVFLPEEYLPDNDNRSDRLSPGATIPVNIQVVDPGAEAQGYEMDVCLPRRYSGLQCQNDESPFRE